MNISTIDLTPVEPLLKSIKQTYVDNGMSYGWKSHCKKEYDYGHWNTRILVDSRVINYDQAQLPMIEYHPLVKQLWDEVQSVIGERTLVRAYVNGYTFGTDAYYHVDDDWLFHEYGDDITSETVLIYLNENWHHDWGGETSIIDSNDNFLASVFPKKNRCLIFDSNLLHRAGSVSRVCPELRSVIVFKTASTEYNRPHVKWIKDLTEDIEHSGTTLFKHLYNTAMTVESMPDVAEHIVNAALYHSIYGTEFFDPKLTVTKEQVVEQIGEKAENLVDLFCTTTDRYNSILNNSGKWDDETHFGLLLLELANTLEMMDRQEPSEARNQKVAALDAAINEYIKKEKE
jgi:SM-20-related protein